MSHKNVYINYLTKKDKEFLKKIEPTGQMSKNISEEINESY